MLLIYTSAINPRLEYVFEYIFRQELGIDYSITTYPHRFEGYSREKISYAASPIADELFIPAESLLFETGIEKKEIRTGRDNGMPVLFPNNSSTGFDVFAAVFYMISRYEEYLPFTPDRHGRFKATDSIAYREGFLQLPVVNIWIRHFGNILQSQFPALSLKASSFKGLFTYDIDIAYAFAGRSGIRNAGSVTRDVVSFNFKNIFNRVQWQRSGKDPWDIYDKLKEQLQRSEVENIFFFLVGDNSLNDRNLPHDHPLMKELVKKISAFTNVGLHPSYRSSEKPGKIGIEKSRLEQLCHCKISRSRQHFLRLRHPETFRELIRAGITEDHSLAFGDMPGFRTGSSTPFYFYDLEKERTTTLKIYTPVGMDATFVHHSKLSPEKSLDIMSRLLEEVKKVNGMFISIWHNNIISGSGRFKGWQAVHNEVLNKIRSNS